MEYKMKTTFMKDFDIANVFGENAVRDTYKRAFKEWKDNLEYITEFTMVLNWQLWKTYEDGNEKLARVYDELWREMSAWCLDNLKGEDLNYYLRTTD
jgi:hypothetical protein